MDTGPDHQTEFPLEMARLSALTPSAVRVVPHRADKNSAVRPDDITQAVGCAALVRRVLEGIARATVTRVHGWKAHCARDVTRPVRP